MASLEAWSATIGEDFKVWASGAGICIQASKPNHELAMETLKGWYLSDIRVGELRNSACHSRIATSYGLSCALIRTL